MSCLIFGSRGFLAQRLLAAFPDAVGCTADIAVEGEVAVALDRNQPRVVINCAGKTGSPNIDWCEDHQAETVRSNVTGPLILMEQCLRRGIHFVHFGSGCVYEGDNGGHGFSEQDLPNFAGSFYSRTKAWADRILSEFPVLILRIRMPFDDSRHPRNLISKLIRYRQVLDAPNSITYVPDLIAAADALIRKRQVGIVHVVNPGTISPYEIVCRYSELVDPHHSCESISASQLDQVTKARRSNCILTTGKLQRTGIQMRTVREAIEEALQTMAEQRGERE